jgi:hypothetical protein
VQSATGRRNLAGATWQAQDGHIGVVLANYADLGESPRVAVRGQGNKRLVFYMDRDTKERNVELPSVIDPKMEPRSLGLIELK